MSQLQLDAEALYLDLRVGVQGLMAAPAAAPAPAPSSSGASSPSAWKLVGITSGGAWLAERLQRDLGQPGEAGVISSAMHRDDYAQRGLASGASTRLPFDVNGARVLLVDDVLYTGRTLRAVLNELFDYGRPAAVRLAVLVDRGGRELPMQPDFAAARVSLPAAQSLELARDGQGRFRFEVEDRSSGH